MMSKTDLIRKCLYFNACGKIETHDGLKWKEHWLHDEKGNWLCRRHYNRLIGNPRISKEVRKKNNAKRSKEKEYWRKRNIKKIKFLDRDIYLTWVTRTGYCSRCPNNIYDKTCKFTNMHHFFYLPIMVWACTEEICRSCHNKKEWSKGTYPYYKANIIT